MAHFKTAFPFKFLEVEHAPVSSSDVVKHLQDELGFAFDCDFILFDNRAEWEKPLNVNKCYVIMRCTFRPEDIAIPAKADDYVAQTLQQMSAGMTFKPEVKAVLEQFMIPSNIKEIMQDQRKVQALYEMGLKQNILEDMCRRPGLFYDSVNKAFGVYLLPEKIIAHMARDPETGNPFNGTIAFGSVSGDNQNAAAITWFVNFYGQKLNTLAGVSIDAVFGLTQQPR